MPGGGGGNGPLGEPTPGGGGGRVFFRPIGAGGVGMLLGTFGGVTVYGGVGGRCRLP